MAAVAAFTNSSPCSGHTTGHMLALARHRFGCDTFCIRWIENLGGLYRPAAQVRIGRALGWLVVSVAASRG